MKGRIPALLLCFFAICAQGQTPGGADSTNKPASSSAQEDPLLKNLAEAESAQRAGNLTNADISNRAVLGIALQRMGVLAIEKGEYGKAVEYLRDAAGFSDSASTRTNLAIAYMRQNLLDDALREARVAVALNPEHIGARYILANIYYAREEYEAAKPELEHVFSTAPDFEIARALGFTYLSLKEIENARTHFKRTLELLKQETAGIHILFAKFYERTNFPADAERELKRAVEIDPKANKVNLYLGYLLMQSGGAGRMDEAFNWFEKELALDPDDFYANFYAGVALNTNNENEKAIPFLKRAIELKADSGESHVFLAQAYLALDDLENAEKNLRKAVALESDSKKNTQSRRTHSLLGRLLVRTGRREEGRRELEIADQLQKDALDTSRSVLDRILGQAAEGSDLASEPDKEIKVEATPEITPERADQLREIEGFLTGIVAQAYANLGVIATQYTRLNDAVGFFSTAYRWNPDFPNLGRNLGIVRFRNAEYESSIEPLTRQLKANPEDALARKLLGTSYYLTGSYQNAVDTLKPIESVLPSDPELAYSYGFSLVQVKRNKEAIPVFEQMAAAIGADTATILFAAQGFMVSGDYLRAIKEFKRVLAEAPGTPRANYFIGQCFLRLNKAAEAAEAFEREISISPQDPVSRYHLAVTLIERRVNTDRAVVLLEEAIRLRPGYADAHYQLGKYYLERGENEKAVEELERGTASDPGKDYIHYQLSIAYRKVKRNDDAERELKIYQRLKDEKRKTDMPMAMGDDGSTKPGQ